MKLKNDRWKQVAVYFTPDQWLNLKIECARHELPMATYVKKRLSNVIDRTGHESLSPMRSTTLSEKK